MSDEWKLGVVYVCPERDIECGSFERNWCANCPKRRATPPSPSTASTQQDQATDLNVMPPFAAPAGRVRINERVTFQGLLVDLICSVRKGENLTVQSGKVQALTDFIDSELNAASRCRAQGGGTNEKPVESGTAPTVEVDERAAFEAWVKTCPGHPYAGAFLNLMWDAWQGRAALASKPPAREAAWGR